MAILLSILTCIGLAVICCAAATAYSRIPDFQPTQADDDDQFEPITPVVPTPTGLRSTASFIAGRPSSVPTGVVDIAMWQHAERTKRMVARLDAIIERSRDMHRPQPVLKPVPVPVPVRVIAPNEPDRTPMLLRGLWILAMFFVLIGSLLPSDTEPIQLLNSLGINDKILHFLAYAVIAFIPAIHEKAAISLWAGVAAVALGIGLEYAQVYAPGRNFDQGDMAANALGVAFGLLIGMPLKSWVTDIRNSGEWERLLRPRPHYTRHEAQPFQMR